jgi:cystathionine beta-lyase/cystathionine gamma-synthase
MSSAATPNTPARSAATRVVTGGRRLAEGALAPTIWPSTTYEIGSPLETAKIAKTPRVPKFYARHGNPSVLAFEEAIADLEGAEASLAFGSGMGALSCAILAFCPTGSHIVAQKQMYGGTLNYLQVVAARLGITYTLVDVNEPGGFAAACAKPGTTLLLAETPANPNLDLVDLDEIASILGPIKLVDATFATPIGQRTLRDGIDMVMHSATKAIGGHNDSCLGVISGESDVINWLWGYSVLLGSTPSPFDASNALRGLRTLNVRFRHQSQCALHLASALEADARVRWVRYPGLASHPHHAIAAKQMSLSGGLLTFDLAGGREAAAELMGRLKLAIIATSLGGPETLVTHPATTSHAGLTEEELAEAGITEGTLRISCGLEDPSDLIEDFLSSLGE